MHDKDVIFRGILLCRDCSSIRTNWRPPTSPFADRQGTSHHSRLYCHVGFAFRLPAIGKCSLAVCTECEFNLLRRTAFSSALPEGLSTSFYDSVLTVIKDKANRFIKSQCALCPSGKELRFIENAMQLADIDFRPLKPLE
jgi:hypothetical protein